MFAELAWLCGTGIWTCCVVLNLDGRCLVELVLSLAMLEGPRSTIRSAMGVEALGMVVGRWLLAGRGETSEMSKLSAKRTPFLGLGVLCSMLFGFCGWEFPFTLTIPCETASRAGISRLGRTFSCI